MNLKRTTENKNVYIQRLPFQSIAVASLIAAAGSVFALVSNNALAQEASTRVSLATGVEYASGDYGGVDKYEDTYLPVTLSVDRGRLGYRLTVPYLRVEGPVGISDSGLGDMIGSVTLYDLLSSRNRGIAMDFTGKVKFATADEAVGLGTGEDDYSVQADFYKFFDQLTLLATTGYKVRGDPPGMDLENVFLGSIGGIYRLSPQTRIGLIYDYRESSFADATAIREITGFVSRRLNATWRLQFYLVNGLSDSGPDRVAGLSLKAAL